ncbi:MAG: hypothetical protein LBS09_00735 [Bacteroidales bacterium]|jgi:hypothetical protein|nr:hypothetical protein [Bacteroidales bacterium]
MMKKVFALLLIVGTAAMSCNKEDDTEEKYLAELQALDKLMPTLDPSAKRVADGLYINVGQNENKKPQPGEFVLVNYRLRFIDNNALELSSYLSDLENTADQPEFYPTYVYGGPELWLMNTSDMTKPALTGIFEAMGQVSEGQGARIYFYSKYNIFTGSRMDFKSRVLDVEYLKVIQNMTAYQESLMHKHVIAYGRTVDTVKVQYGGNEYAVMYDIVRGGSDDAIAPNGNLPSQVLADVNAYYTFQEEESFQFVKTEENFKSGVNILDSNYLPLYVSNEELFSAILKKAHKGDRAIVAMPYILFGGTEGIVDSSGGQMIVPANSVVLFEIALK